MGADDNDEVASGGDRRGIQSIEIGVTVLNALATAPGPLPLKLIAERAEMAPSKAHRYLSSYVRADLVRQDAGTGRYDLGPLALRLGLAALSRLDPVQMAASVMLDLSEETGVTSLLCVWGANGPTVIRWQRSSQPFVTSLSIGSVLPLLGSATGQVFLAYSPRNVTKPLLTREIQQARRSPGGRPVSEKAIVALIKEVRESGIASVDGSVIPGLRAVSSPVLDAQDQAVAAITLLSADEGLTERDHAAARSLRRACGRLSQDVGASEIATAPLLR
jgi:DNA-binding IclR family transcriptional regulator